MHDFSRRLELLCSCRKDFRRKNRKGRKMDAEWLGPLLVSHELGKGFYTLASLDGKNVVTKSINGAHLKVLITPSLQESPPLVCTDQSLEQQPEPLLPPLESSLSLTSSAIQQHSIQLLTPNAADVKTRIERYLLHVE